MKAPRIKMVLTSLALALSIAGIAFSALDEISLVGPALILFSIVLAAVLVRASPELTKSFGSNEQSNAQKIGDLLLLAGCLGGLATAYFLKGETKVDRGAALLIPAMLFGSGVLCKIYHYLNHFWPKKRRERSNPK